MLIKQPVNINFSQGLDTKSDPFQLPTGKFAVLQNSVFDKAGRLTKRNGYKPITNIVEADARYLTTFNGNLTALGDTLQSYSAANLNWVTKGDIKPVDVRTLQAIRNAAFQSQADSITAANGLTCVAYTEVAPVAGTLTTSYKYSIIDSTTGQSIVNPTLITGADPTFGTPRVFLLNNYFVILYTSHPGSYQLNALVISSYVPETIVSTVIIASSYTPSTTLAFDAVTAFDRLYIGYNTTSGGQSVKITYLAPNLTVQTPLTRAGSIATMISMAADTSSMLIYTSFYDSASQNGFTSVTDSNLHSVLAPTAFSAGTTTLNITSSAQNGSVTILSEISNNYTYDASIPTHFINTVNVTVAGVVGSTTILDRSVGLASKAFIVDGESYVLTIYESDFQPTYFLLNSTGKVIVKLAYSNAGSYFLTGLPNFTLVDGVAILTYLYKESIQAANKSQGVSNPAGVFAQLGVNLVKIDFDKTNIVTSEIAKNLNFTGGILSAFDGVIPTEQGFFLYPDSVEATQTSGGSMADQQYYYQVTYEWPDNQGNLFRSAPSIPVGVNVASGSGTASVTLNIPTLRLSYKTNVTIVIYRWSTGQQSYYQTTSITNPIINDPTVDYVTYVDKNADSSVIGNNLIYTTGGVLEDIAAPSSSLMTLFNNRLWLVDSEDRNLLWFSKEVIEATPVEMSDLLTLYVAPTTGSEGSTGEITALAPMDDKLIIYKQNALGYIAGIGPDNTGANSQYTDFTLITSVVGCTNQQSIVTMPQGLMFQSNKGIWLVNRNLNTQYIGAPVESLTTGALVLSAENIPATNQVRFTMDSGITIMYDYYFDQWATFTNVPAVSSTLYNNLHTYINSFGQVFQENPGSYVDGSRPVLMSFTTGWINLSGLQGFQRFYRGYLLGQYYSPFKLNMQFAYNYNPAPSKAILITPSQKPSTWGSENLWGNGSSWGSQGGPFVEQQASVFEAEVFPDQQQCESFQISITEIYDASVGGMPGAGLTLSGMNLIVGLKSGYRTSRASRSFG